MADTDEREWDSEDSNSYQDGQEQAEADIRNSRPRDDRAGIESPPWTEGYRDRYEGGTDG